MIVLDASAAIDLILRRGSAQFVERHLREANAAAPELIDVEVLAMLRRKAIRHEITAVGAKQALDAFSDLPLARYEARPLLPRAWELRHNLSAADALYVALAEGLHAPWLTIDGNAARAAGKHTSIEVLLPS
ncbi:MAG: hypothetical protein QOG26_1436 [Solirubrobacterales bacterium]|nr:hypothetical protein [Solirubrobacterales bacterium]